MLKIKHLLLKLSEKAIFIVLTLTGLIYGCKDNPIAAKYGSPSADYKVKGKITAEKDNHVIKDILIKLQNTSNQTLDSVYSDSGGNYVIQRSGFPADQNWILITKDVDGALNGAYLDNDSSITILQSSLTGGDGQWYAGKAEVSIDLKLIDK